MAAPITPVSVTLIVEVIDAGGSIAKGSPVAHSAMSPGGGAKVTIKLQLFKVPPSPAAPSTIVSIQSPIAFSPLKPARGLLGANVPCIAQEVGGFVVLVEGAQTVETLIAAASSNTTSILFCEQEAAESKIIMVVPFGDVKETTRSLTQVCAISRSTFRSVILPFAGTFSVEVYVAPAPVLIATGVDCV
ncbi:hypothetical protein AEQU2_00494 [Aequorivita lipolytica]|nr:hypothetical protein AEQU2_00494 [Aequorivita lipolytica]